MKKFNFIKTMYDSQIEALPEIVKAVNGKLEVYMDGGIRQGIDVFKALALGAKMVIVYQILIILFLI